MERYKLLADEVVKMYLNYGNEQLSGKTKIKLLGIKNGQA